MRTYILFGYVIIALQCIHISGEISLLLNDEGSGDEHLVLLDSSVWADTEVEEESIDGSGSGWPPNDDLEDDVGNKGVDYYDYDEEHSGAYPVIPGSDFGIIHDNGAPSYPDITDEDERHFKPDTNHDKTFTFDEEIVSVPKLGTPSIGKDHPPVEKPSISEVPPVEEPSIVGVPPTHIDSTQGMDNNIRINTKNDDEMQVSIFARPSILAAFIGGAVIGLLCAILLVMFIVYRIRKRDEGSYPLDEPKRVPLTSSYAPNDKEIYA